MNWRRVPGEKIVFPIKTGYTVCNEGHMPKTGLPTSPSLNDKVTKRHRRPVRLRRTVCASSQQAPADRKKSNRQRSHLNENMIYIVTAMYAEAYPFITRFQLKKDISHTRFQVFLNQEADLCLIISGAGSVPAAVAVSSICTQYGAGQGDFLLNVGVCALIRNKKAHRAENPCTAGKIFLCNKIQEQATGRTFYPDILYRHGFTEAQIITGAKVYRTPSPAAAYPPDDLIGQSLNSYAETVPFLLYDMESAAVYQAGAYYFGPHQMGFLKVVSDGGNTDAVTPAQIQSLIGRNMDSIADYTETLQAAAREGHPDERFRKDTTQKALAKLCLDLHCSRTMAESVRQYIRYCILSGTDHVSVLEEMYRSGRLPCKDKREGKQRFEELKERLL